MVPEVWEVLDKIKAFADKVLRSGGGEEGGERPSREGLVHCRGRALGLVVV